jgi:molybdopterin converting factor small subunit
MFPSPQICVVKETSTLREFIARLGPGTLYAYDQRVIVVTVNGKHSRPSSRVKLGDKIIVIPIVTGG